MMSTTLWKGILKIDNVELRHYLFPPIDNKKPVVLILFGLINYPDILDLHPDRSMIRRLLEQGIDVYLLHWGEPPSILEKQIVFQDYVLYVAQIIEYLNIPDIHLMGVCQGGIISLLYAALFPNHYKKLILFLSPIDFSYQNEFIDSFSCINSDKMVRNFGNIPGALMSKFLALFSPYASEFVKRKVQGDPSAKKSSSFYHALANWAYHSPAQAAFAFKEFINEYIHKNKLVKSELNVLNRQVNLSNIQQPILNIFATKDHLWPKESSQALKKYINPKIEYKEVEFIGGHIAAMISKESQTLIPNSIVEFVNPKPKEREEGREEKGEAALIGFK